MSSHGQNTDAGNVQNPNRPKMLCGHYTKPYYAKGYCKMCY